MRVISTDKRFNPDKLRLVFSLFIALFFSIFITFLGAVFSKKMENNSKSQFNENCLRITDGYAQSVSLKLDTYFFSLDNFLKIESNKRETEEDFKNLIIDYAELNHKDFMNVSFVNLNSIGFSQSKITYDAKDREYCYEIFEKKQETCVTSSLKSHLNEEKVFLVAKAAKDKNNNLKGIITASVKLQILSSILQELTFSNDGYLFIVDNEGRFISHPNSQLLLKTFSPQNEKFRGITSSFIASQERGRFETVNEENEPVYIYTSRIKNCNWTLGLVIQRENLDKYKKQSLNFRIAIMILSILILAILTGFESWFFEILQRHQHIDAFYDSITNLLTRKRFEHEASKILRRYKKNKFMLLETDIRGFKFINQNYGEENADNMIIFLSQILNRHAIHNNGLTGRGFADHIYSLYRIQSVRNAMKTFKSKLSEINEMTKSYSIPFNVKFGISFFMPDPNHEMASIQDLINQASFAKSTLKENLLTQYSIYNSQILNRINEERFIEANMEEALKNHEFFVMYQPKISLKTDKIVGAEALVRWRNKTLGLLTPDSFIPIFERNGFVTKLDFYVYEEVFKFMENQIAIGNSIVPVSVNMSRNHSKPEKFMHDFLSIFKKYSIPSNLIQVEIIERSMMDNNTLKEITENLHKEGFSVAMDDFGSGESSLNMLTKIPVDVLKFDREFLISSSNSKGEFDKKSAEFIEILIEMSKVLDKETVFEGVETKEQRDFLKSVHCDEVQGYFYSKPLNQDEFVEFIRTHI